MTIDLIDQAFLQRLAGPVPRESGPVSVPTAVAAPDEPSPSAADVDVVVAQLLAECPEQWEQLAGCVEAAWAAGERVVAVAGRVRGDGVSTIVHGLWHTLRRRGAIMTCRERAASRDRTWSESSEVDRPELVDGGAWFPAGPVHRGRLARAAFGCHAVILVRRADRPPSPVHAAVLAALGVRVLGEVVTFADSPSAGPTRGSA